MRIVVLTPPRSGSTLVYNIATYLFEDHLPSIHYSKNSRVIKLHNSAAISTPPRTKLLILTTIRNPTDIAKSMRRVGLQLSHYDLDPMSKWKGDALILTIAYEKLVQKGPTYLLEKIENALDVIISTEEKEKIETFFSINAMLSIQKKFKTFAEYDPVTGIHGKHISTDEVEIELFEKETQMLLPLQKKWGYQVE